MRQFPGTVRKPHCYSSHYNVICIYIGLQWRSSGVDLFDCRTQPWYISAVTCSKDVVLLMDVTGSMTGMRFSIARLVAHSLLDTLTSNDFVAVLKFADTVSSPVSCFEDMLVQVLHANMHGVLHIRH